MLRQAWVLLLLLLLVGARPGCRDRLAESLSFNSQGEASSLAKRQMHRIEHALEDLNTEAHREP